MAGKVICGFFDAVRQQRCVSQLFAYQTIYTIVVKKDS